MAVSWSVHSAGASVRTSNRSISRKLSAIRKSRGRIALSDQEQSDLTAPLSQIVNEESEKKAKGDSDAGS